MPEIQLDHFAEQYPNKNNPPEYKHVLAPSNFFAILGGAFAALSSVSAKLAVDRHTELVAEAIHQIVPTADATVLAYATRGIMLLGIGACNFFMWLFFTKALRYGDSTPRVMMFQTVSNFVTTAVFGVYLFGDVLSLKWWSGATLIAVGLTLMNTEKNVGFVHESPDHAFEISGSKASGSKEETKKTQ
ncbi:pyridoxamine-phosphate oxidase [Dipsacomyces acuminosporus]|nr:pyridoxamine-phosphate oxidase [Dipsacomyces acuminosporus]